jgi:hypothetical protein
MRRGDAGGGRLAGGQTPVLSASSEDRAAFGQLLAARVLLFLMLSAMMGDGGAQTLLLDIAFLTTQLRIITQAISSSFICAITPSAIASSTLTITSSRCAILFSFRLIQLRFGKIAPHQAHAVAADVAARRVEGFPGRQGDPWRLLIKISCA